MATVKARLSFPEEEGRPGTVFYQVTHQRRTRHVATSIRLYPGQWDGKAGRMAYGSRPFPDFPGGGCTGLPQRHDTGECPGRAITETDRACQAWIDSGLLRFRLIIKCLEGLRRDYSVDDILYRYESQENRASVLSFMDARIAQLEADGKLGTARNYRRAKGSLVRYLGGADMPFISMTADFESGYCAYLERRGIVRNSVSFYMRILRAVYNSAVSSLLVEQTFPFAGVYTGVDRTVKRAVHEEVISRLFRLDLHASASLAFTRDLFIFSYCSRGMAFVDMAYLRKTDIRDGCIRYVRRKTGQPLRIRLEPDMFRIIRRYSDFSSVYVFPILKSEEPEMAFRQYQVALNYYNRQLKRLAAMLRLGHGLSSYVARHSWATAARDHNIPLSVISAGMGHVSEKTTMIYLAMLENSKIDSANQRIISGLK